MKHDQIKALLDKYGLTVESVFIPWSQSRNREEKQPSLNWSVTLLMNGRKILTTDYMAGMGHCPYYKNKGVNPMRLTVWAHERILWECEHGIELNQERSELILIPTKNQIKPDSLDVIHSLLLDSEVIDYSSFESWAGDFGYDPDSRKDEHIYNSCLKIALQFRQIGESVISELREAYQDY